MAVIPPLQVRYHRKIYSAIHSFIGNLFFHDKTLMLKHLRVIMKGKNFNLMDTMAIRAKLIKIAQISTVYKR